MLAKISSLFLTKVFYMHLFNLILFLWCILLREKFWKKESKCRLICKNLPYFFIWHVYLSSVSHSQTFTISCRIMERKILTFRSKARPGRSGKAIISQSFWYISLSQVLRWRTAHLFTHVSTMFHCITELIPRRGFCSKIIGFLSHK